MKTQLTMRELVAWLKSEQFLKEAGAPGRDPMYGDGIIWTDNILGWISNKLKDLAVAMLLCLSIAACSQAQSLDTAPAEVPQKQITLQRAQSVQLIEDQGKVLILAEGLEAERTYAVMLSVGLKYAWAEIHDEAQPFPPRIQKPNDKGQLIITGKPKQAFFVSLRSATEPPQWVRAVVNPEVVAPPPVVTPPTLPPVGDYTALTLLSKTKASALDRETGLALRQALLGKLAELDARCKAGTCPTLDQAKKEVIETINATPKNQRFDWYGGWRMPISQALLALPLNTTTYVLAMRAVAAGLE